MPITTFNCMIAHDTVAVEIRVDADEDGAAELPMLVLGPNPRGFTGSPTTSMSIDADSMRRLARILIQAADASERTG